MSQTATAAPDRGTRSEVETSTIRAISWRLIPFLVLAYFFSYLDRVNLSFAALTMNAELKFSPLVFSFGAGIFFIGYFVFEVPSNLALERFGASKWIARIMVSWGILSALMAAVYDEHSFYALRFFLGVAEAGFFPGIILYLTYWYPAEYRARFLAAFAIAVPVSTAIGAPISGLLLAGLGQAALFQLDVVQWSDGMKGFERLGQGTIAGIPTSIVMFAIACVVVAFLLRQTRWGAYIYAIGDNPYAARVTGIPSRPIIVLQYVVAALIGCFAGLVMAASVNSMPTRVFNSTLIYDVILVVVLGGIGLSGGRGGVLNVVIGTLLIGTMLNGMTIMDISYAGQNLVKGVVLLLAVITDSFLNPRNEETAQQGDI